MLPLNFVEHNIFTPNTCSPIKYTLQKCQFSFNYTRVSHENIQYTKNKVPPVLILPSLNIQSLSGPQCYYYVVYINSCQGIIFFAFPLLYTVRISSPSLLRLRFKHSTSKENLKINKKNYKYDFLVTSGEFFSLLKC